MRTETIDTPGGFIRAVGTEAVVCRLIAERQAVGIRKYGTTVAENPLSLREWLVHQQQELADALVYCTRALEELDAKEGELLPQKARPDFIAGYDAGMDDAKRMAKNHGCASWGLIPGQEEREGEQAMRNALVRSMLDTTWLKSSPPRVYPDLETKDMECNGK